MQILKKNENKNNVILKLKNLYLNLMVRLRTIGRMYEKFTEIENPLFMQGFGVLCKHSEIYYNFSWSIQGKKWWWPLFTNIIDSVIVNSWKLHRISTNVKCHL